MTEAAPRTSRPVTSPGYGIAGTTDGLLPWSWAADRLATARNYWLCTTGPTHRPHAMPVWGLWLDGAFAFSTDPASRKGRNLAANPAAVVHLESGDDVVVLEGRVEVVRDEEVLRRFCDQYDEKYAFRPDPSDAQYGIYLLRVAVALGWRETDFPASATRWSFPGRSFGRRPRPNDHPSLP